jgi:outer membrane protein assembly factor BamB
MLRRHVDPARTVKAVLCACWLALPAAAADDAWPGLWGPTGDGRAGPEARLPRAAALKIREAWRRPIGSGFSAIAVAGARGYTALSEGGVDHLIAFEASSGRELWRARLGETYRGHDGSKDGPASTPAVDEGRVFVVSRHGLLFAFDAGSGAVSWRRDLKGDVGAAEPFYGFATSPLVSGRHVVVQTGGEKSGLAAFDKGTGATAWTASHSKAVAYSSPVLATLAGTAQLVVLANDVVYGARPEDGSLLWSLPTGWADEATRAPLALPGDRLLISGTNESKLIEVRKQGDRLAAREVWKTPRLKNSLSPTVFHEQHLYGFNSGYLVCLDLATAEVAWREKVYAGSLILIDGQLLVLGAESGELRIAPASPDGYRERLKAAVLNAGATSVSGPAFAAGRLFLRNLEEFVALDIVE